MALVNLPKTAKGLETLERIRKAAEMLFSEKGYYNTSVTDITTEASVAPGTFYIYFPDKKSGSQKKREPLFCLSLSVAAFTASQSSLSSCLPVCDVLPETGSPDT